MTGIKCQVRKEPGKGPAFEENKESWRLGNEKDVQRAGSLRQGWVSGRRGEKRKYTAKIGSKSLVLSHTSEKTQVRKRHRQVLFYKGKINLELDQAVGRAAGVIWDSVS